MKIVLNLPDQHLVNYSAQKIAQYLKLYTALLMFKDGQLSAGAACEFADIDRYTFLSECRQHNIPVIDYEEDEIEADLNRLTKDLHLC